MSVAKSKRKDSRVQYVVILQQAETFFIEKYAKEKDDRNSIILNELVRRSMIAYDNATKLYEMTFGNVKGSMPDKKKACKNTYWAIRELASQLNILIVLRMGESRPVSELNQLTYKLYQAAEQVRNDLDKINKVLKEQKDAMPIF